MPDLCRQCSDARSRLVYIRRNRGSNSSDDLASAAQLCGYTINPTRGRGSHMCAERPDLAPITIPAGRNPVGRGLATKILTTLEEVLDLGCPHRG
jgi:hypothetical protein